MRKISLIIAFIFCIVNSYAEDPIDIVRVKSFAFYHNERWSPEGECKNVFTFYKDKIINKSENKSAEFEILEVQKVTEQQDIISLRFKCFNVDSGFCSLKLTYDLQLGRRCIYIYFPTHTMRYILKYDDEY